MISDTSPEEGSYKVVKSPVRLVVILAVVIFMIEVLVMLLVLSVPGLVGWRAAFVDAALLVILVTPVLYTAAVIPMVRYNVKLDKMEAERNSFFECSLDMLCIAHTDGYFKRINPAFEETLGWSTAELLARPFLDFIHPDDLAATLVEVDKLAAGESVISFNNRYQCKNGTWRWLSWKSTRDTSSVIRLSAELTCEKSNVMWLLGKLTVVYIHILTRCARPGSHKNVCFARQGVFIRRSAEKTFSWLLPAAPLVATTVDSENEVLSKPLWHNSNPRAPNIFVFFFFSLLFIISSDFI